MKSTNLYSSDQIQFLEFLHLFLCANLHLFVRIVFFKNVQLGIVEMQESRSHYEIPLYVLIIIMIG